MMLDELQRRNYSPNTVRSYVHAVEEFARYFRRSPDRLGPDHVREYQVHLFRDRKLSPRTIEGQAAALRFLFVKTLRRAYLPDAIPFPKCHKRLSTVLSQEEVTRLDSTLQALRLQELANTPTAGFSQGERMKVALGRVLLHNPANLLLDEPTNALDIMSIRSLRALLKSMRDEGRCIVFCSHVLFTSPNSAQLRLHIEISHQSVQILGMNAEQSRSLGKTSLCFSQRAKNQIFFCGVEHIVVSRSSESRGLLLEYAIGEIFRQDLLGQP